MMKKQRWLSGLEGSSAARALWLVRVLGSLRVSPKEVTMMHRSFLALVVGAALLSPACVMTTTRSAYLGAPLGSEAAQHGRVEWVRETVRQVQGNPAAGAAAGAVIGGLLGELITGHRGGVLYGAANGAMVGAAASQVHGEDRIYDVRVRFDNGEMRDFRYRGYPPFRTGQSVILTGRGLLPSGAYSSPSPATTTPPQSSAGQQSTSGGSAVQPMTPEPGTAPPPPPAASTEPPGPGSQAAPVEVPPGQWVFTRQYGWVWMPYGDSYMFTPDYENGDPYMYLYYPSVGWTWVNAPWLWGWGPMPYVGISGGRSFGWYGHGWGDRWHGRRPRHYRPRRR
jgi:outer membrane lipoprotein SlyB